LPPTSHPAIFALQAIEKNHTLSLVTGENSCWLWCATMTEASLYFLNCCCFLYIPYIFLPIFCLSMIAWTTLSNLGDIASAMLVAVGIAGFFFMRRAWQLALCWMGLFGCGLMLVVASKVAFVGWGIGHQALDFTGFSGHAMRAMAIFPVLAYLAAGKSPIFIRVIAVIACSLVAALVGFSRYLLHVHSYSEVIAGGLLGAILSGGFILILRKKHTISFYPPLIILAFTPLLIPAYLGPTPTQGWIIELSLYLSGHEQIFVRDGWKFVTPANIANATDISASDLRVSFSSSGLHGAAQKASDFVDKY
jgi:membrane-associated phospholipid phosphatase